MDTGRDNVINDSNNSVTAGARGEGALRGAQRPAAHFTHRPRTDSRPAPRRPRRVALALAVLAVLATVAPEQAVAQSEITLVGNAGQPTGERHPASFQGVVDHAQQFTTGPNAAGDTLTKVEFLSNDAQGHTFSAQLCEANNTGEAAVPDPMNCQTLSTTSSFAQGSVVVFTPPAGMTITLAASTRYVVVLSENNSPSAVVDILSTQANNQNGEAGWTLADVFDWKQNGTTWMKQGSGRDALFTATGRDGRTGEPAIRDGDGAIPRPAASPHQKLVVFTEHRDTLRYLQERITTLLGRQTSVVVIHGSVGREERLAAQEAFRHDPQVQVLLATDAAGEGINLQRAHLMVNYDLPWNPNRLEQRFGRIHRIGQTEVCHLWNLVADETREGDVYRRLLEKLEQARQALGGQVFDVLGKLEFEGRPLRELLLDAIRYGEQPEVLPRRCGSRPGSACTRTTSVTSPAGGAPRRQSHRDASPTATPFRRGACRCASY